jgi:putative SOS response-associated peptidase YedK
MCGRFARKSSVKDIAAAFKAKSIETDLDPSFNIAPTHPIVVIMEEGERRVMSMRWGLIPGWAKDATIGNKLINARGETVAEKPAFRAAFKDRRCLIIADGFYEWKEIDGKKAPMFICLETEKPFAMAGLFERWKDAKGETVLSCTIITTEANSFMRGVHHRMPVIIAPEDHDAWLDPKNQSESQLKEILRPTDSVGLKMYRVSTIVNSPSHNSEDCVKPYDA